MIPFATTSKTIRLALAMTMLTPLPLLAERLTAREMLAQAQSQAIALPGEAKKPGTTEIAKLEVGKAEPTRPQPTKTEPPQVELVPPMPTVAPAGSEKPAPAASAEPASQNRVTSVNSSVMPAPEITKPSVSAAIMPPAAPTGVAAPTPAPAAAAPSAATPAAIAPTPEAQARVSQSTRVTPTAPIANPAPVQMPVAASAALQTKSRRDHVASEVGNLARERVATRQPRRSGREPSLSVGGPGINAQMISRIMHRPEVQSLIAQYGLR
jgi:hypothetical protein